MGKRVSPPDSGPIEPVNLRVALEERYLAYALSTIMHRALPDVRDGLKPVHRRLLYAMQQLRLGPQGEFRKCAKIVGDTMGNFHPHGNQAIYDALARLAQDFSVRYPLIDGQGNFGNIDGDNPAADRYTEARLTAVAARLLEGIDEDTVDFRANYDGRELEPSVLPANFPNLLANGASGIAVGMATNIPPHNVGELCDAALHLIKFPKATADKLVDLVPGPDLPTGGVIVEPRENIVEAYKTGRGSFRLRARWEQEDTGRGTYQIVVTEIPYQVPKARLVARIAELLQAKKLPLLADVRDESAEDVRLILEPKSRTVDPLLLMEQMFKFTELETRVPLNMNVLSQGKIPNVLGLRQVLSEWLDHRLEVLVRRSKFRLGKIDHRLEVLAGYLIVYLNLDKVIKIIREKDEPKPALIKAFKLTEIQAEAILNMRLRALRKLEEMELRREHDDLTKERKELKSLLASKDKQWKRIGDEIKGLKTEFGEKTELGRRRTGFEEAPEGVDVELAEAMIEKEPVTIVLSEKGWIRSIKGHNAEAGSLSFKEGDRLKRTRAAQTTDTLLLFATNGRFYSLGADKLPGGRGHGEPFRLMVDIEDAGDSVDLFVFEPGRKLLVASTTGYGFIVAEDEVVAMTRKGKQILNVKGNDEAAVCAPVGDGDSVAVIGDNRKLLLFPLKELPEMPRGKGVRLQRYKDGGLADAKIFKKKDGLTYVDAADRTFTLSAADLREWWGARAQAGRLPPRGFPKSGLFGKRFD
ncbi:DNA topoisomerase IV subunit A [Methyloceanibacter superfactus]|uniref:DNA topoisomerase 4 subunit A n=1 Tax=Methyloceanibacter superfactus TaxID=1774969 RepID=A0A1E3VL42_9HYPH|nr:DNA topoisomerase IV subunit A [Methyloceanibacter superfactus]ODR94244.1 DNA topoisomerase IV subunit A [Methyloceanibacter superfactus]